MNRKEYDEWQAKAQAGTIKDHENPIFALLGTSLTILSKIAKGEINMQELAKRELENKGRDINGQWVGFGKEIK